MDTDANRARIDALAFLKRNKTGVLATVSGEYDAHASMIYYIADDDFNIYFLTLTSTRKYAAMTAHPQVAFTVSTTDVPQTLQIEGMAMDISLDLEVVKKKDDLFEVLNTNKWFYPPISKLDPAGSVVVWMRPTWIRWADFAFEAVGTDHVLKEIPIKK